MDQISPIQQNPQAEASQIMLNLARGNLRLRHGDNILPLEPLGFCSHDGCQNQAVYQCYYNNQGKRGVCCTIQMPVDCDRAFCEAHIPLSTHRFVQNKRLVSYSVRTCPECLEINLKKEKRAFRSCCTIYIILFLVTFFAATMTPVFINRAKENKNMEDCGNRHYCTDSMYRRH